MSALAVRNPRSWPRTWCYAGRSRKICNGAEQIDGRLRREFPDDPEMRVSAETIYQSLYVQSHGALRRELTKCLRTGRALRRPCRQAAQRRNRIPD